MKMYYDTTKTFPVCVVGTVANCLRQTVAGACTICDRGFLLSAGVCNPDPAYVDTTLCDVGTIRCLVCASIS